MAGTRDAQDTEPGRPRLSLRSRGWDRWSDHAGVLLPWASMLRLLASLVLAALLVLSSTASAQTSATDREEARALFAAGQAAVDGGRWTDALDSFRRAYELTQAPSALFNAAFALRALGRYREAEVAFEELLALEGTRRAMRTEATGYLTEVRGRIAHLALEGLPEDAITTVRLDGRRRRRRAAPARARHRSRSSRGRRLAERARALPVGGRARRRSVARRGRLAAGGSSSPAAAEARPTRRPRADEHPRRAVAVDRDRRRRGRLAAGIVGGIYADEQAQLQPESMMSVRL